MKVEHIHRYIIQLAPPLFPKYLSKKEKQLKRGYCIVRADFFLDEEEKEVKEKEEEEEKEEKKKKRKKGGQMENAIFQQKFLTV